MSKEDLLLQEELITLMPHVNEANAISEELDRRKTFEIVLVSLKLVLFERLVYHALKFCHSTIGIRRCSRIDGRSDSSQGVF